MNLKQRSLKGNQNKNLRKGGLLRGTRKGILGGFKTERGIEEKKTERHEKGQDEQVCKSSLSCKKMEKEERLRACPRWEGEGRGSKEKATGVSMQKTKGSLVQKESPKREKERKKKVERKNSRTGNNVRKQMKEKCCKPNWNQKGYP